MPSSQTPNYNLNQWSKDDRVLMEDFNADNAKIDAAIGGLRDFVGEPLRFASGSYRGTGTQTNTVHMGLRPKFAWITRLDPTDQRFVFLGSNFELIDPQGGIGHQTGSAVYTCSATDDSLTLVTTSTYWTERQRSAVVLNVEGVTYIWCAIGT